jgi:hypothetical protein
MHKTNITEMQTRHMTRMNRITILLVCLFTKYVQCFGFANVLKLGQRAPCSKLSSAFDDYADNLFNRFDKDSSGFIDRNEFRDVAKKMRVDNSRREVISVATAFASSLFVVTESDTFQFGQKQFRGKYLEEDAEIIQNRLFPTALLSGDTDKAIARTLKKRGFTPENTLFGHSVCSDEINNRKEQLLPLMINRWQEGFALGGLGGLPFAGKSGFGAYLHHVPDDGRLLIVFAPHVGIGADGQVGALQRDGQAKVSSACGAAIGAYKTLQNQKKNPVASDPLLVLDIVKPEYTDKFDPQLDQIVQLLAPRLSGIEDSEDSIAFVTYQMYGIIRELITACVTQTTDTFDYASEVAVVGGVIINRRKGGDFFQPLSFESRRKGELPVDLFEETFGERPDLLPVLGSEDAMTRASIIGKARV